MERKNPSPISTAQIFCMQMYAIRKNAGSTERFVTEDRADRELASFTQKCMREKLAEARKKQKQGWWNPQECSIEHLHTLLAEAVRKGQMINIINYAAMIHARQIMSD